MALRHVGFIMDGNGRWAQARSLPREEGYRHGLDALKRVVARLQERGVEFVSVYAFSTENMSRPKREIDAIFDVVKQFNLSYEGELRVIYMGDIDALPQDVADSVEYVESKTASNKGTTLNIALNYGAQSDVVRAAKLCFDKGEFTDDSFKNNLSTAGLPPLDLIVRTGGEKRLSNFMLFEAAYAELIFLDKYWCDMTAADVDSIIEEFDGRVRKFGK